MSSRPALCVQQTAKVLLRTVWNTGASVCNVVINGVRRICVSGSGQRLRCRLSTFRSARGAFNYTLTARSRVNFHYALAFYENLRATLREQANAPVYRRGVPRRRAHLGGRKKKNHLYEFPCPLITRAIKEQTRRIRSFPLPWLPRVDERSARSLRHTDATQNFTVATRR